MSDDPTDLALGIATAVGLTICGVCIVVNAWRASGRPLKMSRSDPDLESLRDVVSDSLPTH